MPSRDVNLIVHATGARRAAHDVDLASRSVGRLGKHNRTATLNMRALDTRPGSLSRSMRYMGRQALYAGTALAGLSVVLGKRSYSAYTETLKVTKQT